MNSYTYFAGVYDEFMDDIPYAEWADNISGYLKKAGCERCSMLDVGCGTGRFGTLMQYEGYRVTGIDLSPAMIKQALKRKKRMKTDSRFYVMDMRNINLKQEYKVAVSVCDSMNYLMNREELTETFGGIKNTLEDGGLFLFDLKTEKFFKTLGDEIYNDENEKGEYYWENHYDEEVRNNEYYISFYIKKGRLYKKYVEKHVQHVFTPEDVRVCAEAAGLKPEAELNERLDGPADYNADRTYYILRKEGKKHE